MHPGKSIKENTGKEQKLNEKEKRAKGEGARMGSKRRQQGQAS